ncbi:MAG: hypothetical protein AAF399_06895 [Bacteroidota bacterium]
MNSVDIRFRISFLLFLMLGLVLLANSCREDPCEGITCQNGGICLDGNCDCIPGFIGDFCQFFDPRQYFGTYRAEYTNCVSTNENHRVLIEEVANNPGNLAIINLGDYACPSGEFRVEAEISGNSLTIPEQEVDCGVIVYTIAGSGTLTGGTILNLIFEVQYDAGGFEQVDACTARLEK